MITLEEAKKVSKIIEDSIKPLSIIIFGSIAKKRFGKDIDILIITKDKENKVKIEREINEILKPFYKNFNIDYFVISYSLWKKQTLKGDPFLALILREGRILYVKDFIRKWFSYAKEELEMSEYLLKGNFFKGACYHAQQVVEKVLKGMLLLKGWELEKIHNIRRLISIAEDYKIKIDINDDEISFMDNIYKGRYPAEEGLLPFREPTKKDAEKAFEIAERIYKIGENFLKKKLK